MRKGKIQKLSDTQVKAIILTEGGKSIGLGHIYRCEAIIQGLNKLDIDCFFIINGNSSIRGLNINTDFKIQNWLEEDKNIIESDSEVLIVDSYLVPLDILEKLASKFKLAVYIDDYNRLEYPPGLVINSSAASSQLNYIRKNGTEYLLGLKYHPLRLEFWDCDKKVVNRQVKNILITFGGTDMQNLTPSILKLLSQRTEINKKVVVSKGFSNIIEIEKYADRSCDIIRFPDAQEMKSIMIETDIAISASGQSLFELARVGTPTIAIAVADNQDLNVKGWLDTGFIEFAGWWDDPDLITNISKKLDHLMEYSVRIKKSKVGQAIVDGFGALQIGKQILKKIN